MNNKKLKRKSSTQERGRRRRKELLDATTELLQSQAIDTISLSDIANKAGISVGSTYHFFGSINDVYSSLAKSFGHFLSLAICKPFSVEESESWQTMMKVMISRSVDFYSKKPEFRQLILSGMTPSEIKSIDRYHDMAVGKMVIEIVDTYFHFIAFPNQDEVFYHAVEIADLFFCLSHMQNGEITKTMEDEASRAMRAYLRSYLPEQLVRRDKPLSFERLEHWLEQ